MNEPVTLYGKDGETLTVYTRSQATALLAGGEWFATQADATAGNVRSEPTPTTAARLDALEAEGAVHVTEDVTEDAAPDAAPEPERPPANPPHGRGRKR